MRENGTERDGVLAVRGAENERTLVSKKAQDQDGGRGFQWQNHVLPEAGFMI